MAIGLLHRRRMMQAVAMDYVQDGFELWLDGINKGSTYDSIWVDLINGVTFQNAGDVQSYSDHFRFNGSNYSYFFHNDLDYFRDSTTVELVAKRDINAWMSVFVSGGQNAPDKVKPASFRFNTNNAIGIDAMVQTSQGRPTYYAQVNTTNTKCTISANVVRAFVNGIECTTGTDPLGYSTMEKAIIGGRWWLNSFYSTGRFIGDLYCLRLYNRILTEQEMLHNQQVDNIRFNLGLTL